MTIFKTAKIWWIMEPLKSWGKPRAKGYTILSYRAIPLVKKDNK